MGADTVQGCGVGWRMTAAAAVAAAEGGAEAGVVQGCGCGCRIGESGSAGALADAADIDEVFVIGRRMAASSLAEAAEDAAGAEPFLTPAEIPRSPEMATCAGGAG